MDIKLIIVFVLSAVIVVLVAGAAVFRFGQKKLAARRAKTEQLAGQAAYDYLKRFEVQAKTSAVLRGDGELIILIETEPHKKLRFSYIIEQPLKEFINKTASVNVSTVYWRFPIAKKQNNVPEVKYPDAATPGPASAPIAEPVSQAEPAQAKENENDLDDYLHAHDYQIEEVSWDHFPEPAPEAPAEKPVTKDT